MTTSVEVRFTVPPELSAVEPPEARGLARDEVRLLVAESGGITHARFNDLTRFLAPGDLLVVNISATIAAAVDAVRGCHEATVLHFSTPLDDGTWVVELRQRNGSGPIRDAVVGETIGLPGGATALLVAPYPDPARYLGSRLWRALISSEGPMDAYLEWFGRPITYGYLRGRFPLSSYQTVFARDPGSAEMPSAARPFTDHMVTDLTTRGITIAPITLHAGVSSLEAGERPLPERFRVPGPTARLVEHTKRNGGRVVAVGTTVTRALETVAREGGHVDAGEGWTDLMLSPDRPARVVDGLITGWHTPDSSHLLLLEAVAGAELVTAAYHAALEEKYLWHEFGDSCLLLSMPQ
jgi:S-adenosylmethionine:tRNA ribosyltransferase-isomerase